MKEPKQPQEQEKIKLMWPFKLLRRRHIFLSTLVISGILILELSVSIIEENSIDFISNLFPALQPEDNQYTEEDIIDESEDDYDYEYDNPNPDFKDGDFDTQQKRNNSIPREFKGSELRKLQSQISGKIINDVNNQIPSPSILTVSLPISKNGIFWSEFLEKSMPKGISDKDLHFLLNKIRKAQIVDVQPPSWNKCGRPKNQHLTLSDGSHLCARYRYPHDYLIQGEVMSFYFGRLLGIHNIPTVVLSRVNMSARQWANGKIWHNITAAGWSENKTVALIQWIENLDRDWMPKIVLNELRRNGNISAISNELTNLSRKELLELMQWSDLVVFDYITGNYDRVASMQDANEKEGKPEVMMETIHNLVKSRKDGGLWLIDNESGLIDAYFLLYSQLPSIQGSRFLSFHNAMLSTFCLFRQSTYEKIENLHNHKNPAEKLHKIILENEPEFKNLPEFLTPEFSLRFHQRISQVYHHMRKCANDI